MSEHRCPPLAGALVALVVLAGALAACGTVPPSLGRGSVSVCYRAIPTALAAVHDHSARLVGVHRVAAARVESGLPPPERVTLPADDTIVCAVVFSGRFAAGQVALAPPTETGRYAIVMVTSRHLRLLAAQVVERVPSFLGRRLLSAPGRLTVDPPGKGGASAGEQLAGASVG